MRVDRINYRTTNPKKGDTRDAKKPFLMCFLFGDIHTKNKKKTAMRGSN